MNEPRGREVVTSKRVDAYSFYLGGEREGVRHWPISVRVVVVEWSQPWSNCGIRQYCKSINLGSCDKRIDQYLAIRLLERGSPRFNWGRLIE